MTEKCTAATAAEKIRYALESDRSACELTFTRDGVQYWGYQKHGVIYYTTLKYVDLDKEAADG